jgi:nicotinate-nucleotide adenylyltransferase
VNLPPHKNPISITPFHHRFNMTELAVKGSPLIDVMDIEGKRGGISYTVDTLKELHKIYKQPELYFIIGMDAFLDIRTWKDYKMLFSLCHFVVIRRPGANQILRLDAMLKSIGLKFNKEKNDTYITNHGFMVICRETTLMDISSTRIRDLVNQGRSIRFLLPDPVIEYISREGLYRFNGHTEEGISVS